MEARQNPTRMPAGPRPGPNQQAALTPKDIIGILRRHIWLIIILTMVGFFLGTAGFVVMRKYAPKYRASTVIRVLPPSDRDPMAFTSPVMNKDIMYGQRVWMATLIKQQNMFQNLLERNRIQETEWFQQLGRTRAERFSEGHDVLRRKFVASPQRDGDFLTVSMEANTARESAIIVNEMVSLFLAEQGDTQRGDHSRRLSNLEEQRRRIQQELDSAERSLEAVRSDAINVVGTADLRDDRSLQDTITLKLNNLEIQQNELMLQINQVSSNLAILERQAQGPITETIENQIETDPIMTMLAQRTALLESQLAASMTKFGENHKVVRENREMIEQIREKRRQRREEIAQQVRQANLQNAQDQQSVLKSRFEQLEEMRRSTNAQKQQLDLAKVQYERRITIRDERKDMLDSITQQIEKTKIAMESPEAAKVAFVGRAPEPTEMSSPKLLVYVPGGTMLGFMLAVGLAFLIEMTNDLVRTPRDVIRYLNSPLLGVIPNSEDDPQAKNVDMRAVVRQAPYSVIAESFRQFRTNLKLSSGDSKVFLVSSGKPGDGKTTVSSNLAAALAIDNKKVLLIETNFWHSALTNVFGSEADEKAGLEESDLGLSNYLMNQCQIEDVIVSTEMKGLDVIHSGPLPSNPGELFGSSQIKQLLESQREKYDYVIVDGPPVLLISDTKMLARIVDGTILVFNAEMTKRGQAQRTVRELTEVDARIVGCVLFAVRAMKGGYFREQFKTHQQFQKMQLNRSI